MSRLPILTFHSIDGSGSVISTTAAEFSRLMSRLAEAGWRGCTVRDALEVRRSGSGADRLVALSFDDGYRSVREAALPVLRDFGFSATVFAIAGRAGGDNRWPGQPSAIPVLPLLAWSDLEELVRAGWEVGSHGFDHLPLTRVDTARAGRELEGARRAIELALGLRVSSFAYPYGVFDGAVQALARAAYDCACGARLALASAGDVRDGFGLPRVDAYYLRGLPPSAVLATAAGESYLAVRRWARSLRRSRWGRGDFDGGAF